MPDAARVGDSHDCHQVDGNRPHRGGAIEGPGSGTVKIDHRPSARAGDRCRCDGPPDVIVTGSESVRIDGRFAARVGDRTMHGPPGYVTGGSDTVRIGGPLKGASLGGGVRSLRACGAAAKTRDSESEKQTYGNCGVESVRQIINLGRAPLVSERALLDDAIEHHEAQASNRNGLHGGSTTGQNVRTLARYGVPAQEREMTMSQIMTAVAEGRGVITAHDVSILWGPENQGGHAVLVTGANYRDDGTLLSVVINDTGAGECGKPIDAVTFERSLRPGCLVITTDRPIW